MRIISDGKYNNKIVNEVRAIKEINSSEAFIVLKVVKEEHSRPITTIQ